MLEFLNKHIYRGPFILYTLSLLLATVLMCSILIQNIFQGQIEQAGQETQRIFLKTEQNLSQDIWKIDDYFARLYADPQNDILIDFVRFLDNNFEDYILSRLQELPTGNGDNNFPDNLQEFVTGNDSFISEIRFTGIGSSELQTRISFEQNGASYDIEHDFAELGETEQDISKGYSHIRRITQPGQYRETIGQAELLIRPHEITKEIAPDLLGNVVVTNKGGLVPMKELTNEEEQAVREIYEGGEVSGSVSTASFKTLYYFSHASEQYGYTVITFLYSEDVIARNRSLILLTILAALGVFVFVTLLIAARMSYDARYLDRITNAINQAKGGKFTKINLSRRRDEYTLIAEEFNDMADKLDDHIKREYAFKIKQREAEMKMLQQQINPHFLYNTLEVIRSRALVFGDGEVADAVSDLGGMFRSLVKSEDIITVEQELALLTQYLRLMKFKFQDNFFYQIDIEKELYPLKTVKFWLQPLLENFFVHGFQKDNDYNLVIIRGTIKGDDAVFEIVDNGIGIEPKRLTQINRFLMKKEDFTTETRSIGIQNVYTRLLYFYAEDVKMEIENNQEAGITIRVTVKQKRLWGKSAFA